jgi:hypothetical protein
VRDFVFPFIVQEIGREPAKLEIEVRVLVKGPFSSRGEITIMRRFERRVVGGSPAARSNFSAWPSRSGLRLLSGTTQVQILPRGPVESESAEARTLSRKQKDRPDRLGRKTSALRHFSARSSRAEQPTDNRPTLAQYQAGGPLGELIPQGGSRGANACGDQVSLRGGTSTLRHCRVV